VLTLLPQICTQIVTASIANPVLLSLSLELGESDDYYMSEAVSVGKRERRAERRATSEERIVLLSIVESALHHNTPSLPSAALTLPPPPLQGKITEVEAKLRLLADSMSTILSESDYAKDLEISFHAASLSMNAESAWWPLIRIGVMVLVGVVQAIGVRKFFQKKKLV